MGTFDYLNEYCKVVYLERTEGISSTELRSVKRKIKLGIVGDALLVSKVERECKYVNGLEVSGVYTLNNTLEVNQRVDSFEDLLNISNALHIISKPSLHYSQIKRALECGKHILCEAPLAITREQSEELHSLADKNGCILMDSIKTAFSIAYQRMVFMAKGGKIGKIVSVDATATSLRDIELIEANNINDIWSSINAWGPTVMLPVFQLFGTHYQEKRIVSRMIDDSFDTFTKIDFLYDDAVATVKVGKGVKSEGELIISGTKGYIYVPAPWWKTDYFEVRYENPSENKRFFYQLDGEGIRYELVSFLKSIQIGRNISYISREISDELCHIVEDFYSKKDFIELKY